MIHYATGTTTSTFSTFGDAPWIEITTDITLIPEPSALGMTAAAALAGGVFRSRRRR